MKKITSKLWMYGINFLVRAIAFNISLAFAIVALVYVKDGLTMWAIISIASISAWLVLNITGHLIWASMKKNERALYFGIRRFKADVVKVTEKEISRRSGQADILEVLRDTDSSLEVMMLINGTGPLVNVLVGTKWLYWAIRFHNNEDIFKYEVVKES